MPTVFHDGNVRFFFYSLEGMEPPHVHIEDGDKTAKYWLNPIELAASYRFRPHELNHLRYLVIRNRQKILEAWHEHFGD